MIHFKWFDGEGFFLVVFSSIVGGTELAFACSFLVLN